MLYVLLLYFSALSVIYPRKVQFIQTKVLHFTCTFNYTHMLNSTIIIDFLVLLQNSFFDVNITLNTKIKCNFQLLQLSKKWRLLFSGHNCDCIK